MSNDSNRGDVAVFIDFENVYVSVRDKLDANPNFEAIMDRCEDLGRVIIARAYADWYRYPRITSALYANGIEPMYVPTYYYDRDLGRTGRAIKNSVDMNLCVEAMRTLYTNPNIAKFVLATGDRDFIPLVNAIRQQGKEVIVIGIGGAASSHLAQSADEFLFYESLIGKPTAPPVQEQPRTRPPERIREVEAEEPVRPAEPEPQREATPDIYDTLVQAIHLARERGYVCSFGSLKLLMKELTSGEFKESRYKDSASRPFAKFKDFVMEGERRGKVQVFTNGAVNEVFLPGEDPYTLSQFAQELKDAAPLAEQPAAEPEVQEARAETRSPVANGRRRRRRPRGEDRPNRTNGVASNEEAFDLDEEPDNGEAFGEATPFTSDDGVPEEVLEADFSSEADADAVFDQLLEQVESLDAGDALEVEAAISAGVDAEPDTAPEQTPDAPADVLATEATNDTLVPSTVDAAVAAVEAAETVESGEPTVVYSRPFEAEEWQVLRDAVARYERPMSFVQIHDALRDARNRELIGRTNEELRSLVKQSINSGILERIGKGTRISYRLSPVAADTAEDVEANDDTFVADAASVSDEAAVDTETQAEQISDEQAADAAPDAVDSGSQAEQIGESEAAPETSDQLTLDVPDDQPTTPVEDVAAAAEETADQTMLIEQTGTGEVAFATPESPVENSIIADQETTVVEPKPRRRRARKAAAEAPAEAQAEIPVAEAPAEPAEPAKPRRRRTRKAAAEDAEPQNQ